jgi:DNA processing protein
MTRLDERLAWICLASVSGVADGLMGPLIAHFGSAADVLAGALDGRLQRWSADRWRAEGRTALSSPVVGGIAEAAADPDSRLSRIRELRLWTVTPLDEGYPSRLRDLDPPPALLHGWGDPAALSTVRAVALVGTRRPTPAGRLLAGRLAARLVECRATVISGLAVGIDGAAHAASAERGGRTVAVIGAGHRWPGPRAHAGLRGRILQSGGAIISEHHPDVGATRGTYPRRNRIIAALAEAVLVVEAALRSGALITARHALELGRPVYVAPGRIGDWSTAGALGLLRETPARPLVGLDELVTDLGYLGQPGDASAPHGPASRAAALAMLGGAQRAVAERLCQGPAGLDVIVHDTQLAPATVSGAVSLLLMRGWAQAVGPAYLAAGPLLG